ncbi:aldose epimerase family protein [Ureibacillus sinduriensis]|uniref:Aldose 1-epimerase n=1 Tax=Ureibacillus sinduriensis BLB-1 = JCM 15800 TaxID=1384057 RepID=A0A0A3HNU5_9BACL|nr:aldose epimerase family protein [Ureibacillus sinduriensis]KGR74231.1 hypothetical protein CD33_19795 [Ureibacillus sinduriensis BLB-1 = JCM 15800]
MITVQPFGSLNGVPIEEITMTNNKGMSISSCTLGCIITEIMTEDREGNFENVVCSFDSANEYQSNPQYFGAAIGRFAGRLENALVEIDGVVHSIEPNEGGKHLLHGGNKGFHNQIWRYETGSTEQGLFTKYLSTGTQDGFPGTLTMTINYILTNDNELIIEYNGESDKNTLLNCTNHSYFNLSGNLQRTIHDHELQFCSKHMLYLDEEGLPLGELVKVVGTPFDFNTKRTLNSIIGSRHSQVSLANGGIDHPFLLESGVIHLSEEQSGRQLTIKTDDPAVVIYTGSKIGNGFSFKKAQAQNYLGLCLEVQNLPNSMKYRHFPSSILRKGERYYKKTTYKFSVE